MPFISVCIILSQVVDVFQRLIFVRRRYEKFCLHLISLSDVVDVLNKVNLLSATSCECSLNDLVFPNVEEKLLFL